jgi:hypothetical protein
VASVCLFPISRLEGLWEFKKCIQSTALADDKITQVRRKGRNKMKRVESLGKYFVKGKKSRRIIPLEESIHK